MLTIRNIAADHFDSAMKWIFDRMAYRDDFKFTVERIKDNGEVRIKIFASPRNRTEEERFCIHGIVADCGIAGLETVLRHIVDKEEFKFTVERKPDNPNLRITFDSENEKSEP